MAGLCEFAELVHLVAKDCLESHVIVAQTPSHKFDVVAAAMRSSIHCHGERSGLHALCFRKASRYCRIVPALNGAIEWDLDLQDGTVILDVGVSRRLLHELHQEIVAQHAGANSSSNTSPHDSDTLYGQTLQTGSCRPHTLQRIKEHLPKDMHQIVKLWDDEARDFTYDDARIVE